MIAIFAAIERETHWLERRLTKVKRAHRGPGAVTEGQFEGLDFLLIQTGIGRENAEETAEWVLSSYSPEVAISTGFAGGISKELKVGDLVICPRIYAIERVGIGGDSISLEAGEVCHERLVLLTTQALERKGIPFHIGDGLTVPRIIGNPPMKGWINGHFQVKIADMESYWIAQRCARYGVPFLVTRAIVDTVGEGLPDFSKILRSNGTLIPRRAIPYLLAHPQHALTLGRLAFNSAKAARSLSTFITALAARLNSSPRAYEELTS